MSTACIAAMAAATSAMNTTIHCAESENAEPLVCLTTPELFGAIGIGVAIPIVAILIAQLMNL